MCLNRYVFYEDKYFVSKKWQRQSLTNKYDLEAITWMTEFRF